MRTTNRLTLIGHVRSVKKFDKVTKTTVATNRRWVQDGEEHERASFVPISILDKQQASFVAENVRSGDLVHVEARVEEGSYGEGADKTFVVNVIAEQFNLLKRKSEDGGERREEARPSK